MNGDGFLHRYFLNNGEKRLHKWLHYFDIYERHFERFRDKSPVVLEIGVAGGGSLAMWKGYFGPGSKIIGVDIDPQCKQHEAEDIEIFIGSQDDPALFDTIFEKYPHVDIVIDDGSHIVHHIVKSFLMLYARVSVRGVYLIEDLHTNYWEEYGGGLKKADTFIEFAKSRIDDLNACHTRGALPPTGFTAGTDAMSFYDSVIVFEKRPQGMRQTPITNGMFFPR